MKKPTKFQPTSSLTRRRFLTTTDGLLGCSALAACVPGERGATPESPTANANTSAGTTTTGETPATVGAETYQAPGFLPYALAPAMLEVLEERGDTVLVRHLMGETAIPKHPQRIYADASTLDILLTLGVIPVGANSLYADGRAPAPLLAPLLEQAPQYQRSPVNLEVVASHHPDVILVREVVRFADDPEELYTLLNAIAPTVVLTEDPFTFWQQATDDIAAMLGISDRAQALRDEHAEMIETQCERIRRAMGKDE
ncbi:MAG: ABC transporter substrate-binding protein, partial [Chloroflexales bacterium]|nr:ABC transporter substrate-binding protein [Chloroflexales bacterium]